MVLPSSDRDEINQLLASWALGYDERDVPMMARCFATDATMTLEIPEHPLMGPYVGHAEVMKHFIDHHAIQTDQRRHVVPNVLIEPQSATVARVTSLLVLLVTDQDGVRTQATGVYRDRIEKITGRWQIRERRLRLDAHY